MRSNRSVHSRRFTEGRRICKECRAHSTCTLFVSYRILFERFSSVPIPCLPTISINDGQLNIIFTLKRFFTHLWSFNISICHPLPLQLMSNCAYLYLSTHVYVCTNTSITYTCIYIREHQAKFDF